jgi:glycosyltransferase involved in cell wall biosynthesis
MRSRINIGYWPWELAEWPEPWRQLVCLVDEVWVSTKFTANALQPLAPFPVYIMPMAVDIGEVPSISRSHFGLPEKAKLFCFSFDLNSSMARKNPQACVDAFRLAFPQNRWWKSHNSPHGREAVGLVIKVQPPASSNREWEKLKRLAARDDRIHIIESNLPRPELLALYKCCDCFVSLHRAEGFGRGLAEALLLGLHLITTNYSGNVDFCKVEEGVVDLVPCEMKPIRKGEYPFADGQSWAEPVVEVAAQKMRDFFESGERRAYPEPERFSLEKVGDRYRKRLEALWQESSSKTMTAYPRIYEKSLIGHQSTFALP